MKMMKKFFLFLLLAAGLVSCKGMAALPSMNTAEFSLTEGPWTISGKVAPKWMQELGRTSWDVDGTLLLSDVYWTDKTVKIVFPGGGYRETTYQMDKEAGIIRFAEPLFYATPQFEDDGYGADILSCKFAYQTIKNLSFQGVKLDGSAFVLFDEKAASPDDVSLENRMWRCYMVPADAPRNTALYEIDGMFGYMSDGLQFLEDGPFMLGSPYRKGARFPKASELDLSTIYLGPVWRHPTLEEATRIQNASKAWYAKMDDGTEHLIIEAPLAQMVFTLADGENEAGFWIEDGQALVVRLGREDRQVTLAIETPANDARYCLWPVRK